MNTTQYITIFKHSINEYKNEEYNITNVFKK